MMFDGGNCLLVAAAPHPLWRVLAVAVLVVALPMIWRRHLAGGARSVVRFSSLDRLRRQSESWASRARILLPVLRTLAMIALAIALWRPQRGYVVSTPAAGIAIEMIVDTSGSMLQQDFEFGGKPATRLDAVKQVFREFVLGKGNLPGRHNDLIGLTVFAQYADVKCPLTLDYANLINIVSQTKVPKTYEQKWTALGDGMALAIEQLRKAGEWTERRAHARPPKSRVAILLTDGRDNPDRQARSDAPDPREVAEIAAKLEIKIYTIGAGSDGLRSAVQRNDPMFGAFFDFRTQGQEVDEETLRAVADATGGKYFRATDSESLVTIYEEIDRLERSETGDRKYTDNTVVAGWAMAVGLALLCMEVMLVNTRFRKIP